MQSNNLFTLGSWNRFKRANKSNYGNIFSQSFNPLPNTNIFNVQEHISFNELKKVY